MLNYFQVLNLPQAFRLSEQHIRRATEPLLRISHPDAPCGSCERYGLIQQACHTLQNPTTRAEHLCGLRGCSAQCPAPAVIERELGLAQKYAAKPNYLKRLQSEKLRWIKRFEKAWERQNLPECGQISVYLNFIESQIQQCKGQPK